MSNELSTQLLGLQYKALSIALDVAAWNFRNALAAKFSPDQPRDSNGRWTNGGGIGVAPDGTPIVPSSDGGIFKNKEGLLPQMPHGYYRILHGTGISRWVLGAGGEVYWSPDHYASFIGPF